jgi:hypothetical protein
MHFTSRAFPEYWVYEIVVGKQPTVGADYADEQTHPASRKASEADKSAMAAIMEINQIIRISDHSATGRSIGDGRDQSGPTAGLQG